MCNFKFRHWKRSIGTYCHVIVMSLWILGQFICDFGCKDLIRDDFAIASANSGRVVTRCRSATCGSYETKKTSDVELPNWKAWNIPATHFKSHFVGSISNVVSFTLDIHFIYFCNTKTQSFMKQHNNTQLQHQHQISLDWRFMKSPIQGKAPRI